MNGPDGNAGVLRTFDLSKQPFRDAFYKGSNAGYVGTAGFAVVISKHENRAAFIDLQPLFQRMREMYFTTEANFAKTRDAGPGPKQWPYEFDADPTLRPKVVKVVAVTRPTAVLANLTGGAKARAMIASEDGRVGVYKVGGFRASVAKRWCSRHSGARHCPAPSLSRSRS